MSKNIVNTLFENIITIVSQLFIRVIKSDSDKKAYHKHQFPSVIARIRVGHIFTAFIFLLFSIFDYFLIVDKNQFAIITIVRLAVFFIFLVPFFLFTFSKNFYKYIRPSLFITYLVIGGFIMFLSYLLDSQQIAFFHNYLAVNCLIIILFIVLTYKVMDTVVLVLIYIVGYNVAHYINILQGNFFINEQYSFSHSLDINVWFFSVSLVSYLMWRYNENVNQQYFLTKNELEKQKLELEDTNKIKNKFIKIISHDLKNLIGPQYSLANFLANKHNKMSVQKRDELIKMIESSAQNTLDVFEELIIWIKAQTNSVVLDPQYLKLHKVLANISNLLRVNLEEKNISIVSDIGSELLVFFDENSLKTVLRNVIGNAIKFSHPDSQINIVANKEASKIVVSVIDKGIGIADEDIKSIFKIDVANSQKGTAEEEGTGLGLILCNELMRINKGKIWVESKIKKGTTVFLELPLD